LPCAVQFTQNKVAFAMKVMPLDKTSDPYNAVQYNTIKYSTATVRTLGGKQSSIKNRSSVLWAVTSNGFTRTKTNFPFVSYT